jgi:hypothetical protein
MKDVYTIKNYRTIRSDYGDSREDGYSVTIYRNEKRLGTYTLPANGGIAIARTIPTEEWKCLVKHACTAVKKEAGNDIDAGLIVGMFIEPLIEEYERAKQMRRWCKRSTLFTIKGDKEGTFRQLKTQYSPRAHFQIVKKYGDRVTGIWNADAVKVV